MPIATPARMSIFVSRLAAFRARNGLPPGCPRHLRTGLRCLARVCVLPSPSRSPLHGSRVRAMAVANRPLAEFCQAQRAHARALCGRVTAHWRVTVASFLCSSSQYFSSSSAPSSRTSSNLSVRLFTAFIRLAPRLVAQRAATLYQARICRRALDCRLFRTVSARELSRPSDPNLECGTQPLHRY